MLTVLALTVCGFSGLGCTDEELTAPRRAVQEATANTLVVSDSLCAKMQFTITSATAVTTAFPNRTTCGAAGLVLIRGQAATWAQSPNRRLTLYVRLLNTSGQTLQLPVRLYLPPTGITVVAPSGTPASKVVPLGPDSVEAGGGKIWFVGGSGTLAANDSTVQDTIRVNVMSPVTQVRFQFQASAQTQSIGLPPVPTSMNLPSDSTFTLLYSGANGSRYYRRIVGVVFDDTTSGAKILQVLQQFGATITGGLPNEAAHGAYVITIPDPGSTSGDLDSIRNAIAGAGGVRYVFPIPYRGIFDARARFPTDGQGSLRADWFTTPSGQLSGWRAVRAPLAWGCETGLYGSSPVRIGIVDFNFDAGHPDLVGSATVVLPRPADSTSTSSALTDPSPDPASGATVGAVYRTHGTAVAGIVAARGDNAAGIAGMVWKANLSLFAYGRGNTDVVIDPTSYWATTVVDSAIKLGVRILTTSNAPAGDSTATIRLEEALAKFLQVSVKNIFVLPTPNYNFTLSIAQLATTVDGRTTPMDRAAARLFTRFPGQVIFVAGTNGSGGFCSGGAVWTGPSQVAAPAVGVKTLARRSDFTTGTIVRSGTSYAGPFVAGLAAALVSMDSSLSGSDVTSYITRGNTVSRIDPLTGQPTTPSPLGGGPAGFHELDAYGALSLLSKERRGTPVCGFPVYLEGSSAGPYVLLTRNGSNADTIPLSATAPRPVGLSVAQGGRLLAVGGDEWALTTNQWAIRRTIPGVKVRTYLEKDTVDSPDAPEVGSTYTIRGSRWGVSGTTLNLTTITSSAGPLGAEFSPDAAFVVFSASGLSCLGNVDVSWLLTLPNGPLQPLVTKPCSTFGAVPLDAVWDPAGLRFILAKINGTTPGSSTFIPMRIVGGVAQPDGITATISGRSVTPFYSAQNANHSTDPSGVTATWSELDDVGNCFVTTRLATGTFAVLSERSFPQNAPFFLVDCMAPLQTLRRAAAGR